MRPYAPWFLSFGLLALAACGKPEEDEPTAETEETGQVAPLGPYPAEPTSGGFVLAAQKLAASGSLALADEAFALESYDLAIKKIELSVTGEPGTWVIAYDAETPVGLDPIAGTGTLEAKNLAPGDYAFAFVQVAKASYKRAGTACDVEQVTDPAGGALLSGIFVVGDKKPAVPPRAFRNDVTAMRYWYLPAPLAVRAGSSSTLVLGVTPQFDAAGAACDHAPRVPDLVAGLSEDVQAAVTKLAAEPARSLNVVGVWASPCQSDGGGAQQIRYEFKDDDSIDVSFTMYTDNACASPGLELAGKMSYTLGKSVPDGSVEVDAVYRSIHAKALDQGVIDGFLNPDSVCGISQWQLGQSVDCTGKAFAGGSTLPAKDQPTFNLLKRAGNQVFFSEGENDLDGTTPEKRAVRIPATGWEFVR